MLIEKLKPIVKGYIKAFIPFFKEDTFLRTGGTDEADYCYSTWLRHLIFLNSASKGVPGSVLEIGPGDTLGTGISALLSGADRYVCVDIHKYWNATENVKMFDELVLLFLSRATPADSSKYPSLTPCLDKYYFPQDILTDEGLAKSLSSIRLAEIRNELSNPSPTNKYIQCYIPWKIQDLSYHSIDFIFSQSVLQYTNLETVYSAIERWLKPGGATAHVIDFSSLGVTKTWNGHWTFSKAQWKHYSFRKKMLLNRSLLSEHEKFLQEKNFEIVNIQRYKKENSLKSNELAAEFRNMPVQDIETHAAYILAIKNVL